MSAPARPLVSLLTATVGYGLTFCAWTMLSPVGPGHPAGSGTFTMLAAVAVVVGSLGRIPVGMLTDRYGARVLLPAIGVCAAFALLALAAVDSGPELVVVAAAVGVAGTTFAAGSALVVRAYPVARRGIAVSLFGAGMAIAAAAVLVYRQFPAVDRRHGLQVLVLALALVGYAALAAVVIRDRPDRRSRPAYWRTGLAVLRLPATRYLSAWYAIAFGGQVALGLYLPAYLGHVYDLGTGPAVLYTVACLTITALCRPVGGWLCQRHDPVPALRTCFVAAAVISVVLAFAPPFPTAAVPVLVGLAACLGVASGLVQAATATTVPPQRAGTVVGTVGAVGGLAGLVPPLLLAAVKGANGSYGIGLTLLAGAALAGAAHLHVHRHWIGTAIVFPATVDPERPATSIVALRAASGTARTGQLVAALVGLATRQELTVVSAGVDGYPLVAGLRLHLPRHRVVAVLVGPSPHADEIALIADLVNDGALPVVLTTAANPDPVALHLATAFDADHVLCISPDHLDGILPQPPWTPAATITAR